MKTITKDIQNSFRKYLIEEEKSDNTTEKYIRDIRAFALWSKDREINKTMVLEYKKILMERYAPASVNSILSSLNSFFSFNRWFDCKVKTIKIQRRIFSSKDKELTKTEYKRLLNAAKDNERLYYLMQTICSTGIRVSELKFITVDAIWEGQAVIHCKGKMRTVILPAKLCKILKQYVNERNIKSGAVFVTKNGKAL